MFQDLRYGLRLLAKSPAFTVVAAHSLALGLLQRVSDRDPLTFAATSALLALVAVAASSIPAWRATRIDPLVALRTE